jgi:nucleotide-binding universal stress UspA family protein
MPVSSGGRDGDRPWDLGPYLGGGALRRLEHGPALAKEAVVFERLLVAVDGSAPAGRALAAAAELASRPGTEVHLVHVREFGFAGRAGEDEPAGAAAAHRILEDAVEVLTAAGVTPTSALRGCPVGHVARDLLDEARVSRTTVIVMGSRGHGDLEGLVLGSTAHKVLHLGALPVVIVR